jgi:negative regulator of flagellin synthesis FlgM
MIKSVSQGMSPAIEAAKLRDVKQAATPVAPKTADATTVDASTVERVVANPAARVAQEGPPIDLDRIARIKQAIKSGNYPVDPEKIAEKMVDLDLPKSFN